MATKDFTLHKWLISSAEAGEFYLDYAIFGLFYFERNGLDTFYADKRLAHFLNFDNAENIFHPRDYFDHTALNTLHELCSLSASDLKKLHSFHLNWTIDGTQYEASCKAFCDEKSSNLYIGLQAMSKEALLEDASFKKLFDHIQAGLLIADKDTTILEINDVACSTIGLPRQALLGRLINDPSWILFDKNMQQVDIQHTPVCMTSITGKATPPMILGYHKHDEPELLKWVELSATPLLNQRGELDKIACTFLDVTEEHEIELQIKQANEELSLFNEFIESGPDGLQVSDHTGRLVFINTVTAERLAIKKEDATKYSVIDFENIFETQEDWDAHFSELKEVEKMTILGVNSNLTTGEKIPVEVTVNYACINDREYVIANSRDISDRINAQEELLVEKKRIDNIIEGVKLGTWEWNLQENTLDVNSHWADMLGYTLDELSPASYDIWKNLVHPNDLVEAENAIIAHTNGQTNTYEVEFRMKHRKGHWVWIEARGKIITLDENQNPVLFSGIHHDITERKMAELNLESATKLKSFLIELASEFINVPVSEVSDAINGALEKIGKFFNVDRTYIFEYDWQQKTVKNTYEWCAEGVSAEKDSMQRVPMEPVMKWVERHRKGEFWGIYDTSLLDEDDPYKHIVQSQHIKSLITFPLMRRGECIGSIGFDSVYQHVRYSKMEEDLLSIFSNMLVNVFDRMDTEQKLIKQTDIRAFLIELASKFINISLDKVSDAIDHALANIGQFLNVDRAYIFKYDWQQKIMINTFEWCAEGIEPEIENLQDVPTEIMPHWVAKHRRGETVLIPDTMAESVEEGVKEIVLPQGIKSLISLPLMMGTECIGFVGFDSVRQHRMYSEIEEGLLIIFANMLVNITVREMSEQELRNSEANLIKAKESAEASEKRLLLAAKAAQIGVWDWDLTKNTLYWDDKSFEIFGRDKDRDQVTYELWYDSIHTGDAEDVVAELGKALNESEELNKVYRIIHPNGELKFIHSFCHFMKNADGTTYRAIGLHRDVTKEKLQQEELKKSKEMAEAASLAKSEFLANMSHEIRTPLNSVIGFTDLLLQTELTQVQQDYMQSVNYSADTLLSLINDILDFSKIEAGKLELEEERTDLHALLSQILEMVKFKLINKDIELLLFISPKVPQYVKADSVRIRQILVNLMSNATKFTEQGEIEMSLDLIEEIKSKKAVLRFEVRDTGIGISEQKQQHIFEAFSQEDTSTTRSYGGTGLGLTISNKLLALMNSSMQLQSKQGEGSRFFFDLELKLESGEQHDSQNIEGIHSVLVVDDNARSLEIIRHSLQAHKIEVDSVTNGIEALSRIQSKWKTYDAVLVDFKMPFMDGKLVARQIRDKLKLSSVELPIVLMHNMLDEKEAKSIKDKYSISAYLQKPLIYNELKVALKELRSRAQEIAARQQEDFSEPVGSTLQGKSVLIVDDNAMNRKLAKSMIAELYQDIEIVEVESGEFALDALKKMHFDLILMDIQMPGMSGYEATEKIRQMQIGLHPSIIIALTAATAKGDKERCIASGMDDYLSKPLTLKKFKLVVKKWIDGENPEDEVVDIVHNIEAKVAFNYAAFLSALGNNHEVAENILEEIKEGYLKEIVLQLKEVVDEASKKEEIRSLAHKIKGICRNLYLEKLEENVTAIEELYPNYHSAELNQLMDAAEKNYFEVEKLIMQKGYL